MDTYELLKKQIAFQSRAISTNAKQYGLRSKQAIESSEKFRELCCSIRAIVSRDKSLKADFNSFRREVLQCNNKEWAMASDPHVLRHHQITAFLYIEKYKNKYKKHQNLIPYLEILREGGCTIAEEKIRKKLNK